jgi:hypothetical protein
MFFSKSLPTELDILSGKPEEGSVRGPFPASVWIPHDRVCMLMEVLLAEDCIKTLS